MPIDHFRHMMVFLFYACWCHGTYIFQQGCWGAMHPESVDMHVNKLLTSKAPSVINFSTDNWNASRFFASESAFSFPNRKQNSRSIWKITQRWIWVLSHIVAVLTRCFANMMLITKSAKRMNSYCYYECVRCINMWWALSEHAEHYIQYFPKSENLGRPTDYPWWTIGWSALPLGRYMIWSETTMKHQYLCVVLPHIPGLLFVNP